MSRKKITRDEAAAELHGAYTQGYEAGQAKNLNAWSTPDRQLYGPPWHGAWAAELRREWDRGYTEGQQARQAELEYVTLAEVEKRVALAIAELPECRPPDEEETPRD